MIIALLVNAGLAVAQEKPNAQEKILSTRATISEAEKNQRESLGALFMINKKIRQIAKKRGELNDKMLDREAKVRIAAQELQELEKRAEGHKDMLNQRLRQLYQSRGGADSIQWLFTAKSPVELERNHRFLKRMIDADQKRIKQYVQQLKGVREKRNQLKTLVAGLAQMQKEIQSQEDELTAQMRQKSRRVNELKKIKDSKLTELQDLRAADLTAKELSYAFFERKGTLRSPVDAPLAREYGTYVDGQFRFRLMHKGLFYSAKGGHPVKAVFEGTVALAAELPGYGKTVIIDHGDNYYSVYAFAARLIAKAGTHIAEGETVAISGGGSPLFGPGLYFEIRHFTDAIDPRNWIKDSLMKTSQQEYTWDAVSGIAGR